MTQDIPQAPESPAAESTPEVEAAPSRLQQLLADVRQAGAYGQAQWQRWIDARRAAPVEAPEATPADAPTAEAPAAAPWAKRLLDSPAVLRAQRKGASLLLGVAAAVRAQAEQLERGLERLAPASEADAVTQ